MFPPLFGCRTNAELCRVRGWDKNLPARLLGALPKRSWIKRLRRLGLETLIPLWRYAVSASEATRSRWQWTWVGDDSVFKKYGAPLGLVGTWGSGQEKRVLSGIDEVLLVVLIGDGKLVVPVDFAIRRPDPMGPGAPCRDKLRWLQVMAEGRQPLADAAYNSPLRSLSRIGSLALRSSCARWPQRLWAFYWLKGKVRLSLHCQTGARSRAMTCRRQASGPGDTAHRRQRCVTCGCGPPVQPMGR